MVLFTAVNIRKFVLRAASLGGLVDLGSLTPQAAAFLDASVRAGLNISLPEELRTATPLVRSTPPGPVRAKRGFRIECE